MKRFHVHVGVTDLAQGIRFYSALFNAQPSVTKDDYAKWMLEDPRINFAISTRSGKAGFDHLGLQADEAAELDALEGQLKHASGNVIEEKGTTCCYAASDKSWVQDPAGIAWEAFHTLDSVPVFGAAPKPDIKHGAKAIPPRSGCCTPSFGGGSGRCS